MVAVAVVIILGFTQSFTQQNRQHLGGQWHEGRNGCKKKGGWGGRNDILEAQPAMLQRTTLCTRHEVLNES